MVYKKKTGRPGTSEKVEALKRAAAKLDACLGEFEAVEKALEESEARYGMLVKHSSDGVFLFNPRTLKILEANASFLRMTGYRQQEIVKHTLPDIVAMKKKELLTNVRSTLSTSGSVSGLRQYRKKDGSLIDVEITSSLINHNSGQFIMVNVRDVTERLRAQHELERQAAILRDQAEIIEIAEDAIIVRDMHNRVLFWNSGARHRFGFTFAEARGQSLPRLLKTTYPEPIRIIEKTLMAEGKWEGELLHSTKTGRKVFVESRWKLRTDGKGKPVAVLQIDNDITERKRAADVLQKSKEELERRVVERTSELMKANARLVSELKRRRQVEDLLRRVAEQYKNLFDNSPLGMYRTNPEGKILMANPTLIRMMGYRSYEEFASVKSLKKICEPTYLGKKIRDRLEREGRVRGFEARWKLPDKSSVYVRENARAIRDAEGQTLFYEGTVEDINERKQAEERIEQYQKQLRSLASELSLAEERERRRISNLLHDHIGQLLATAKMRLGSLKSSMKNEAVEREIEEIRDHIGQAIQYGRSLTFELSPPILYDLGLEAALEWLTEQVEEQSSMRRAFESDGKSKPLSDEIRVVLFTAVRELLVNVIKHAVGATEVKVTVRRIDENISIHVADDGTGFNASKRSYHIAEARGFGLFSIRERLHSLGGHMDVRSQVGRGTRIILLAPLRREEET